MREISTLSRPAKLWLHACIFLVFCMVVIGGLTRLTESGLSIVEWKLISGILPPLSTEAWQQEFTAYQTSPQYREVNRGMSLEEFQGIFWLEYIHRLLGRLVGLTVALPLALFWLKKQLPPGTARKMLLVTLLVGSQGVVGWYMVKSGLMNVPWVSPYRLAFHLGLAAIIFGSLIHVAYTAQQPGTAKTPLPLFRLSLLTTGMVFVQLLLGALVAGLDAGLTYNTWPLMDGSLVPNHLFQMEPVARNFFEHIPLVQFQHRWFAILVLTIIIYQHVRLMLRYPRSRIARVSTAILAIALGQVGLGIATLLLVVPITLAVLHQATALLLIGFCIYLNHMLYCQPEAIAQEDAAFPKRDEKVR